MNIIVTGGDYTKKEIYNLTRSPKIVKMSDYAGEVISVDKYILFEDEDRKNEGSFIEILSVESEGEVYATNSQTVITEFREIVRLMDGEPFSIEIMTGTSKNGRTYLTVALA